MAEKAASTHTVHGQLEVLASLEDGTRVRGHVLALAQPLQQYRAQFHSPLAPHTPLDFQFYFGHLFLLSGTGHVISSAPNGDRYVLEIEVTGLDPDNAHDSTELLASFVEPETRKDFLAEGSQPGQDSKRLLMPWIEATSRLHLLVDLIASINSTVETDSLLLTIMEAAKEVMEGEASSLMLLDNETNELVIAVPTGPASDEITGIRIPSGEGIGGWVATRGEPLIVSDVTSDPRFFGEVAQQGFRTRDLICVPLRSPRGEVIGVLQAVNKRGGRPYEEDDLPIFSALADQAAIAIERDRLTRASLEKQLLDQQLNLARNIQQGFWPKTLPDYPGVDLAGMSIPAAQVGGDHYDFIRIDDRHLGLVIADISGKGMAAALLMATLRATLRAQVENHHPVAETVSLVNATLVADTPAEKFVTLFFGVLDVVDWRLTYVNAGHNPPILYDKTSQTAKFLEVGGPIVGFRADLKFESGSETLNRNQVLVLFTDGVTEAQNERGEFYGDDRLMQEIVRSSHLSAGFLMNRIHQSVVDFVEGAPQHDDITLLIAGLV